MHLNQNERRITGLIFAFVILFLVVDILGDLRGGATFEHILEEGFILLAGLAGVLFLNRKFFQSQRETEKLKIDLVKLNEDLGNFKKSTRHLAEGFSQKIDEQLTLWGLTQSEKEVALLIIKGLSNKEIAQVRDTSESTIRQQATSIYHKANLAGRNELAAFFLEDLFTINY